MFTSGDVASPAAEAGGFQNPADNKSFSGGTMPNQSNPLYPQPSIGFSITVWPKRLRFNPLFSQKLFFVSFPQTVIFCFLLFLHGRIKKIFHTRLRGSSSLILRGFGLFPRFGRPTATANKFLR